ncbi:dipeptidase PepE [Sediminicola luteus]|uniref:Dipeptidase E n=1 Tax=Sediminicola luteus TaxID=319238 RepID=A0A2A4G6R9_9FLAO|nr:dipeptidase PepE [Sediminicola luteus]PCE63445.1 dipeptidase E [Sediminicola luteus]
MTNMLLASTSTMFGSAFLEYLLPELEIFFENVDTITFVPYARPSGASHDSYTQTAQEAFKKIGKKVVGIHTYDSAIEGLEKAEAIFVGGGNSFVLLNAIYENGLLEPLRERIKAGIPYLGSSAGINLVGKSIATTNDMPIVYPPSFLALHMVPFNFNAHYLDPDPKSTHKGETRETRIQEFHTYNETPVLGLREGNWIRVQGNDYTLCGPGTVRLFRKGKAAEETDLIPSE